MKSEGTLGRLSDVIAGTRVPPGERTHRLALDLLLLAVASHSLALGLILLFFPRWALELVGWEHAGQIFWPCQAGLFLVILGTAYGWAVRVRPLVWLLIGSKSSAILFLLFSFARLDVPPVVLPLGIGDGLMGLAVAIAYWRFTSHRPSGRLD